MKYVYVLKNLNNGLTSYYTSPSIVNRYKLKKLCKGEWIGKNLLDEEVELTQCVLHSRN